MAYNEGIPSIAPQAEAPSDYQNVQDKVGPGLQALGQGASQAGEFFGQVAADNAFNDYQDRANKILHGDPNKTVPGPDGQSLPDTGYLGLQGRTALDARPGVQAQLDELTNQVRGTLQTPEQVAQFETYSRRYRIAADNDIGTHADTQTKNWYTSVNAASEKNAVDEISNNATDPVRVRVGMADLTAARVKQAQLTGAVEGDPVYQAAVDQAHRDGVKAQILAIGAGDPSFAMKLLQKQKGALGIEYDDLYNSLLAKANDADGISLGQTALDTGKAAASTPIWADPSLPVYRTTVAAVPGGYSSSGLARVVQLESSGNPDAANASDHVGLGQFSADAAKEVGITDRTDPEQSILGIQKYAAKNAPYLNSVLGRPPTDVELYLAHQQGAGGFAKLIQNPDASAAALVGTQKIIQNGGTQGMTARQFVEMWAHKFGGTTAQGAAAPLAAVGAPDTGPAPSLTAIAAQGAPGTAPEAPLPGAPTAPDANPLPSEIAAGTPSAKANAYQSIIDSDASPAVKQRAMSYVAQQLQAQAIAADATASAAKAASDKAANGYMTQILSGGANPDLLTSIAKDPDLEWQTKETLTNAAAAHANTTVTGATASYGPGFWKAYGQALAPPGDPSRITDTSQLLRMAAPGPNGEPPVLTLAGAQYLNTVMGQAKKSVNDSAVADTQHSLMAYAKSKLSFEQDTGPLQIKDPEGEKLFNARFVPQFLAAYDKWNKDGKDPWDFLTQDNVDKMLGGLRSPREMAMAKLAAMETGTDTSNLPAPPAPKGVDEEGWKLIANMPTLTPDGKQRSPQAWIAAVTALQADPSPEKVKQFDAYFGPSGISSDDVLDTLGIKKLDADKIVIGPHGGVMMPNGVENTSMH